MQLYTTNIDFLKNRALNISFCGKRLGISFEKKLTIQQKFVQTNSFKSK